MYAQNVVFGEYIKYSISEIFTEILKRQWNILLILASSHQLIRVLWIFDIYSELIF